MKKYPLKNHLNKKKHNIILLLFFIFFIPTTVISQPNLQKKISISATNKPLSDILLEISEQADINFSYSNEQINTSQRITLVARNKSVKEIFTLLFTDINIEYFVVEKQIILKPIPKKETEKIEKNSVIPPKYTISGYLRDEYSGEILIGATVYIKNIRQGTSTNAYGFYSITLPTGNYEIEYSYIGYNKKNTEIKLTQNVQISENLEVNIVELKIVLVSQNSSNDIVKNNPMRGYKLTSRTIIQKPVLGGEFDAIKTLSSISGIGSFGDGSVIFNVRGGNKDQNLIIIDEAPVYNPSHLLGFFSAIAPDVINNMKVYKSDFPIQYGGRASSIVVINTKDGSTKKMGFSGNISPIISTYNIDGPIVKEKSSFLFTLRNSHINWLYQKNIPELNIKFFDFHSKLNFKPNRENRFYFSLYSGYDMIKMNNSTAMSWTNFASTFRWNHLYSDRLFSNTIIYVSNYDYNFYTSLEDDTYWNSSISNISLKNDFTLFTDPNNTLKFGFNINGHYLNPGNFNAEYYTQAVSASNVSELVAYFGNEYHIKDKFSLFMGVRLQNWNNNGPAYIFGFDENYQVNDTSIYGLGKFNSFFGMEPRININYAMTKKLSIKLSYNRNIQYLHLLSNSISPFTTLDVWLPSNPNIKPLKSNQYVIGLHQKYSEIDFTIEAYYKKTKNNIDYDYHPNMFLNPFIEGELRFGTATASGIEFSVQKQKGNFTMFLAYTYSRVWLRTQGINANRTYPATYDKPHNININFAYEISRRWFVSINWIYASGIRFSAPTSFYYYQGYSIPIYTKKNNAKLPDYHRLDIAVKYNLNKRKTVRYQHFITFSIFNLYGRKNPVSINFNKIETQDEKYFVPVNYLTHNDIVPTQISLLSFIPSISYQFKFK